eukprot:scaffold836_cov239-Pinguiococcus_pyrenoidosus.AAC.3
MLSKPSLSSTIRTLPNLTDFRWPLVLVGCTRADTRLELIIDEALENFDFLRIEDVAFAVAFWSVPQYFRPSTSREGPELSSSPGLASDAGLRAVVAPELEGSRQAHWTSVRRFVVKFQAAQSWAMSSRRSEILRSGLLSVRDLGKKPRRASEGQDRQAGAPQRSHTFCRDWLSSATSACRAQGFSRVRGTGGHRRSAGLPMSAIRQARRYEFGGLHGWFHTCGLRRKGRGQHALPGPLA